MRTRRDLAGMTAGAVIGRLLPFGTARAAERDWPVTLFPPGNHPRLNPHPDLRLLLMSERHTEVEAAANGEKEDEARCDMVEQSAALVEEMAAIPATTLHGMQAKARAILEWDGRNRFSGSPQDYPGDKLVASLLRDLIGGAV